MNKFVLLCAITLMVSSCAGTYKSIQPKNLSLQRSDQASGISYAYSYNVLQATNNKKYANKEAKKGIKLIALEIKNHTERTINFRNDIDIYSGGRQVMPMEANLVYKSIKQPAPLYLLWGLLWLTITKCEPNANGTENCNVTPIPLGLGIGLINVGIAGSANKKFLEDLLVNNILDKDIPPGETVTGLIGISTELSSQLSLQIKQ